MVLLKHEDHAPRAPHPAATLRFWRRLAWNAFLIAAGSAIFCVSLNSILIPQHFVTGGIAGVALIIHYLAPVLDTGLLYFILNIPLMALGWWFISRRFMLYTAFGTAVFSLLAWAMKLPPVHIKNQILAAVLAGIISGIGSGITLRSLGSAGGLDILAVYLYKKWGLRMGSVFFAVNALVLVGVAAIFEMDAALYSLIYLYTTGKVMDPVLTGFNQRKSVFIVSDRQAEITDQILHHLHRGVTYLKGEGAYTGTPKNVIFTIITMTELPRLKEAVFDIDPHAFMVVNDTLEVIGRRHGNRVVY